MNFNSIKNSYTLANGVKIPCVGFGTWQTPTGEAAERAVKEAIVTGYRHIDTAAGYGNEESVGKGIKASNIERKELFITSKLNNPDHGYENTINAFEETMRKLDCEYLDLYLIHWPNPLAFRENWKQANAGSWKAMEELYKDGRIKAIGVSNFMPHHLDALLETASIVPMVNQIRLCPGTTQSETVAYCREKNILLEAYSPLATGQVLENEEIQIIAKNHNKTVAGICMRWSLQMGFLPLPKTVTPSRMIENTEIFDFNLSQEEVRTIAQMAGHWVGVTDPDETSW